MGLAAATASSVEVAEEEEGWRRGFADGGVGVGGGMGVCLEGGEYRHCLELLLGFLRASILTSHLPIMYC